MEKNYYEIILNGWVNHRNHLDKYIYRQLKLARDENFEPIEFFEGCLNVINSFKEDIKGQRIEEQLRQFNGLVNKFETEQLKKVKLGTYDGSKFDYDQAEKEVEVLINKLYNVDIYRFLGDKYNVQLNYSDVLFIESNIFIVKDKFSFVPNEKLQELEKLKAVHEVLEKRQLEIDTTKNFKKRNKLTNPIKSRFCELCHDSSLRPKDVDESKEDYCKRICLEFGLEYTDNVRQGFSTGNRVIAKDERQKGVIKLILPIIPNNERKVIEDYLSSNGLKLYA